MQLYNTIFAVSSLIRSPVIRREEHKGVLVDSCVSEGLEDLPHSPVQLGQRVPKMPSDGLVGEPLSRELRLVRVLERHVEKEWLLCSCEDIGGGGGGGYKNYILQYTLHCTRYTLLTSLGFDE